MACPRPRKVCLTHRLTRSHRALSEEFLSWVMDFSGVSWTGERNIPASSRHTRANLCSFEQTSSEEWGKITNTSLRGQEATNRPEKIARTCRSFKVYVSAFKNIRLLR